MAVEPRSRANRVQRKKLRCCRTDDPKTCPRCGNPCHALVIPYFESPWSEWGGFCCECAIDAEKKFDAEGWPVPRPV